MSFVDLATLAMHRRNELEERLNLFNSKCEAAIRNIKILKTKAQGLPLQLNCEPKDLKERFLTCMQELEKYLYLITDVVLATETLDEPHLIRDCTPVLDSVSGLTQPLSPTPFNIIDTLSEAGPSQSISCNHCPPEKPKRQKIPKEQQVLIQFSSTSCSQESVNEKKEDETIRKVKEIQPDIVEDLNNIKLENADTPEPCVLPGQDLLEVDHTYTAMITHVEGLNFWAITANIDEVHALMTEMTDYYKANHKTMTLEEMQLKPYCAFLDDNSYYRALFVKFYEDDKTVEVYLIDTGELRIGPIDNVQPLLTVYIKPAPYARHCHLAGVDAGAYSEDMLRLQEEFIKKYIMGTICTIQVDENTSESLGVYVILPNNEILNDIMAREGLILPLDKSALPTTRQMPTEEYAVDDDDLDITDCPEYEDPVEAVTGYHNRDEADICKYYKGGPEKTCFKGNHCNKKHIMKHPDGWTLDRVPVVGKCKTVPLPPPDAWVKVLVTYVPHFNRVFVQLNTQNEKEEVPAFGTVLPPRTLAGLNRDMNSPATRSSYQPLTVAPAPGELVAAIFPLDKNYYRARVRSISRADQSVELMYVDYGTVMYVKENEIKVLNPRFTVLPIQAIPCILGGVTPKSQLSQHWAQAKMQLEVLTQDKIFDAHVLAREYDEIVVALFDKNGHNIAEKLAEQGFVNYEKYDVVHDADVRQRIVVP